MENDNPIVIIVLCVISVILGIVAGGALASDYAKRKAAEAGAGGYIIDQKTGDADFVYGCGDVQ